MAWFKRRLSLEGLQSQTSIIMLYLLFGCFIFTTSPWYIPKARGKNTRKNDNSIKETITRTEKNNNRSAKRNEENHHGKFQNVRVSRAQMIAWKPWSINSFTTFRQWIMEVSKSLNQKIPVFRSLSRRQGRQRKKNP